MLIPSQRHSARDLDHWARLERYDAVLARSPALDSKEAKALDIIRDFCAVAPTVVFVSWGKDSVVVADLAARSGADFSLVWSRIRPFDNPESVRVRDAFLGRYPSVRYTEATITCPGATAGHGDDCACLPENLRAAIGSSYAETRHVSGVRAQESGVRRLRMRIDGVAGEHTCRPIGWWSGEYVFAYLRRHDLPVHPAYAMSFGGAINRNDLRVDDLGGERGRRFGRETWERRYYGREMAMLDRHQSGAEA